MKDNQDVSLLGRVSKLIALPALKLPAVMLLLIIAVTGILVPSAIGIQNDDDVIKFLPQDDPKIVKFKDVGDKFHGLQMAIVGIEAPEGETIFTHENIMLTRRFATEFKSLNCHRVDADGDWMYKKDADGNPITVKKGDPITDKDGNELKDYKGDVLLQEEDGPMYEMIPCVSNTTSFTEISDIGHKKSEAGEELAIITDLVPEYPMPGTPEAEGRTEKINKELKSVQEHVRMLDHVNGFLVSDDGRAVAVYAQVDDVNVSTKEASDLIVKKLHKIMEEMGNPNVQIYYGGSPFIGMYSADTARADMMKVSPWVALIVLLIIFLTSRSIVATLTALFSVCVSIVWVMGGMALLGHKLTLISTSLPVLLMALGSAYSIHLINAMLTKLDGGMSRKDAMVDALIHTGPPIIVCVLTTAAGFFSFCFMDVNPMVEYGAVMSISTLVIMIVTFWVVTSACTLLPIKPKKGGRAPAWAIRSMQKGADAAYARGKLAAVIVALIVVTACFFASRVEPHGETSSLFAPGSLPVRADDYMNDNFGGSNFIQTEINADISSPLVLRQVERMTAYIKSHERIAGIQSISDVVNLVGGSMGDGSHITESYLQAKNLTALAFANDASVAMELSMCACEHEPKNGICLSECVSQKDGSCLRECTPDMNWKHSLMQIRVAGKELSEGSALADEFQVAMKPIFAPRFAIPREKMNDHAHEVERAEMSDHLKWIFKAYEHRNNPATGKPYVSAPLTDDIIKAAIFDTNLEPTRDDIRTAVNVNLFADPENAFVVLDMEKTNLEALTDQIHTAVQNGTYNQKFLHDVLAAVADEEEDDEMITEGVKFLDAQILDVKVEKNRLARAAKLFEMTKVTPSEKFDELVKSAIWSLDDKNVFLPMKDFPELHGFFVEFHSPEIAADIHNSLRTLNGESREDVKKILLEKLFETARVQYLRETVLHQIVLNHQSDSAPVNTLTDAIVQARADGTYSEEWLTAQIHSMMKIGEEIEVIPSGYPIIYKAMNDSVVRNQIVSLVLSFFMVLLCLILFTKSLHTGAISIIPALVTVLTTFGVMGVFGMGLDVGSSMIAAISLSVGIDYACHLIWKFGRPPKNAEACQKASDHMIATTGWGVVINALEVGLGFSVLYFGELIPMRNFGVLTGVAMIASAIASLMLLSGLLRWARLHSSRTDVVLSEGVAVDPNAPMSMEDMIEREKRQDLMDKATAGVDSDKPADDGVKSDDAEKPADDADKPADDGAKSDDADKPADDADKPADDADKPADDADKPVDDADKPADDANDDKSGE